METVPGKQLALVGFDAPEPSAEPPQESSEDAAPALEDSKLAPMLRQYKELKRQYPEHVLLFQVGDFYEMFFDDAIKVSEVLGIRLTSRDRSEENRTPMCGVPIHAIESYLPRLLEAGLSCVLYSQVEEDKRKGGLVRREISRIVTPGVRFEGDGLEEKQLNYLAALVTTLHSSALSYTDVSTGRFRVLEAESLDEVLEAVERIRPAELVLPLTLFRRPVERDTAEWRTIKHLCRDLGIQTVLRAAPEVSADVLNSRLKDRVSGDFSFSADALARETRATVEMVLNYVDEIAFGKAPKISSLTRVDRSQTVFLDGSTCRNLELFETRIDRAKRHSLLSHIDRCRTCMGSRMLSTWMLEPSSDEAEINSRLDAVAEFVSDGGISEEIRKDLMAIRDLERILSRVTCGRVTPRDLLGLRDSLAVFPTIGAALGRTSADRLVKSFRNFDSMSELSEELERALAEDAPAKLSEGGIFRSGYSSELDELRRLRTDASQILAALETEERERSGIPNLKIRYNGVFGYFLEVSKSHLSKVPSYFERRQTLANAERFVTPKLKELEQRILSAKAREFEVERELFADLRTRVGTHVDRLQRMSTLLAELDVVGAFASVSRERNYVRPQISRANTAYQVRRGRHPVVEEVVGRHRFVPNDVELNCEDTRCAVLTGPNMGGKSTYLRQIGLIQILAQMGCFVPAESASLPIVDRIFTRIGSADDLSRGDSTFMVEMREATAIVRKATARSLVLIDEIGRGTATTDGLAIATAIVEWLHERVRCMTVFATHFHELTALAQARDGMFCLSVGVLERERDIEFTHRIEHRAADRSYGLEVARLAGLPEELLQRAEEVLARPAAVHVEVSPQKNQSYRAADEQLLRLGAMVEELKRVEIERLTPLDALVFLQGYRERLLTEYLNRK